MSQVTLAAAAEAVEAALTIHPTLKIYTGSTYDAYGSTFLETVDLTRFTHKPPTIYQLSFFNRSLWRREQFSSTDLPEIVAAVMELYPTCDLSLDPAIVVTKHQQAHADRQQRAQQTKADNITAQVQAASKFLTLNPAVATKTSMLTAAEFHVKTQPLCSIQQLGRRASEYYRTHNLPIRKTAPQDDGYTYSIYEERVLHAVAHVLANPTWK